MKSTILTIIFVAITAMLLPTFAQTNVEGSKDHPILIPYPGSYIASYEEVKFREYSLATGPITGYRYIEEKETLEGQWTRITYQIDKNPQELSISEVYRDYLLAIEKAGISIIAKGSFPEANVKGNVGGGGWIGVALKPNSFSGPSAAKYLFAGTSSAGGTFSIIGKVARPDGLTYVAMYGERHSDKLVVVHVDVIELADAETGLVSANADYIRQQITDKGSVTIYGINFDFDSAVIKPESDAVIAEIAKYLNDNSSINLYVVGHTDMKGTLTYNLKLSKDRATAVREALMKNHDIKADRLIADGVAFLSPVATNDTDNGRELNRRTELVRRFE